MTGKRWKGPTIWGLRFKAPPMKENFKSLVLQAVIVGTALAVLGIAGYSTLIVAFNSGMFRGFDRQFPKDRYVDGIYQVERDPADLPKGESMYGNLAVADVLRIRRLLVSGQYEALNRELDGYQQAFEYDQADEYRLRDAYNAFQVSPPLYENYLAAWRDALPDSYQPSLALALYYYGKGWESRGTKYAKDTPEEQFRQMNAYFDKAGAHADTALRRHPDLMIAYDILMGIANTTGDDNAEDRLICEAKKRFPHSYLIRATGMWAKQPRWGGSYREMEAMARQAEAFYDENPRLAVLYGMIYADQSGNLVKKEAHDKALAVLDKALLFGGHSHFYYKQARIHYQMKAFPRALEAVNHSVERAPTVMDYYLLRSRIRFAMQTFDEALADLRTAEQLRPEDSDIRSWRDRASGRLLNDGHAAFKTDLEQAIQHYNLSARFDAENAAPVYWRGVARYRLKETGLAMDDFQAAIRIDPRHFESVQMMDRLLSRSGDWDGIIRRWDAFLALEPDHAGAYYERSGTHFRNKDMARAIRDLKQACDLGHEDACKRYRKMNQQPEDKT